MDVVVQDEAEVEFEVTPTPDEQVRREIVNLFTPFPFTHETRDAIFARRVAMSDELVFDLLLEQASIASPQSLYPPDSVESLLDLLDAIADCPWDTLKKSCLQFYLLSHVSSDSAAEHATACALPPQFVHLAQACFLLDAGSPEDLGHAVALLSDARIVQDLSSKILQTLSLAPQPVSSRLVRTYVRTAQPVLEDFEDLAIYLRALIEYSLADAWSFQRTFSETAPIRNHLIRTVLDNCLIPPKPTVLPHFLALPLTSYEFNLLQSYTLTPPDELSPAAHAILQDLITVRLLHSGKYSDAVRISRKFDTFNAKSRSNAATPLHKAAEERQQMMRDVLAVVPEVQRRQLELELNHDRGDPSLSTSWTNVPADISMSWESLAASGSTNREKAVGSIRSGKLEGSPAPALPGRSSAATPFAFTSPAQKRKVGSNSDAALPIFGGPTRDTSVRMPVFPQIPAAGLVTSSGAPSGLGSFGFSRSARQSFGTPSRPAQEGLQAGTGSGLRVGMGLNARNAFYEPEPSRAGPSLFAQSQVATSNTFTSPVRRNVSGGETSARGAKGSRDGDPALDVRDAAAGEPEDIEMLDSDDPDGFVVRGRRRPPMYPPTQNGEPNVSDDAGQPGADSGASLFGRRAPASGTPDNERDRSERVLPGGFTAKELAEDTQPAASGRAPQEPAPTPRKERPSRTRAHADTSDAPQPTSSRLKIPGGLFEDDAEAEEEQDDVPSLPPAPAKGGRRKRTARASSVTDSEEDDHPRTPLRRSSRLSSTGPSPEPPEPKRPERKSASKRVTKATTDGPTRRKRKNAGD